MNFNIAIVDDLLFDKVRLSQFIYEWGKRTSNNINKISSFPDGQEFLKNFLPENFNIIFMDILMKNINGIQTAKKLRELDPNILIIFLTVSSEYAFDTFPLHPFDYILKPCTQEKVDSVLNEVVRVLEAEQPFVKIKVSHSEFKIPLNLIISAVSHGHKVEINLLNGKSFFSNMRFREIEDLLTEYKNFLLCNRGILVNMSYISTLEKGVFIMRNGSRFPLKINGQSKVVSEFSQFLITKMTKIDTPPSNK